MPNAIPEELKKLHRREYMRKYRQRIKEQSLDCTMRRPPVPLRPLVPACGGGNQKVQQYTK